MGAGVRDVAQAYLTYASRNPLPDNSTVPWPRLPGPQRPQIGY